MRSSVSFAILWVGTLFIAIFRDSDPQNVSRNYLANTLDDANPSQSTAQNSQNNGLDVKINIVLRGSNKPLILGETNLPDGIKLMFAIVRKQSAYVVRDNATVKNGKFKFGPFTQGGDPLNAGEYSIEINMPSAHFQPKNTIELIGENGSKLKGPLASKHYYPGEITINYKGSITIDGIVSKTKDDLLRFKKHESLRAESFKDCKVICAFKPNSEIPENKELCVHKCVVESDARLLELLHKKY